MSQKISAFELYSVFFLFLIAPPLEAKYVPPPLFDLLGGSELVAIGVITEVRHSTFILKVETIIAGIENRPSIAVQKFQDWTCSRRWQPYRIGQRVMIFAETSKEKSYDYSLRSAGAEGEFPLDDQLVYLHGYHLDGVGKTLLDGKVPAHSISVDALSQAIQGLRNCFLVERDNSNWPIVRQTCSETQLSEFRKASVLHRQLADAALQSVLRNSGPRVPGDLRLIDP